MILRYIFGTDIFISYARADGRDYAKKLKERLSSMDYACFIDYDKLYAGDELGKALEYAIQRSRVFVLVGTPGVRQSEHVPKEVAHFVKTGRKLVPINVLGGLRQPEPWDVIQREKLIWIDEPNGEDPSQVIYDEVNRLFKHNRRNVWIRGLISGVAMLLLTISIFAFWKASEARANQRRAEEKTAQLEQEQKKVRQQTDELLVKQTELAAANKDLEEKKKAIEAKTKEVLEQARIAQQNAQRAQAQQLLAEERQQTALSREVASSARSQTDIDPELSVMLAREALVNIKDTDEARAALRSAVLAFPARAVLCEHRGVVQTAEFSADSKMVVTSSTDGFARVWDAATGEKLKEWGVAGTPLIKAELNRKADYLVALAGDFTARLWEIKTGKMLVLGTEKKVNSLTFSPDGETIAITNQGKIQLIETRTGRELKRLGTDPVHYELAEFNRDGTMLVGAGDDRMIHVWRTQTGEELKAFTALSVDAGDDRMAVNAVESAGFSPDGRLIFTLGDKDGVRVWDWERGSYVQIGPVGQFGFSLMKFSPDGKLIVTGSTRNTVAAAVWRTEDGKKVLATNISELNSVDFSIDGNFILLSGKSKATEVKGGTNLDWSGSGAQIWDVKIGKQVVELNGHTASVNDARFSFDGKSIVTAGEDQTVRIWKFTLGKEIIELSKTYRLDATAFSPDGKFVIPRGWGVDEDVPIWETATGRLAMTLVGHAKKVLRAAYSSDGKKIVTASWDNTAKVWDAETGTALRTLGIHIGLLTDMSKAGLNDAKFSHDGTMIATAGEDHNARIWDEPTGKERFVLSHPGKVLSVAFSTSNDYLVTATNNDTARVWDTKTGKPLGKLETTNQVDEVQFSALDNYIILRRDVLSGFPEIWEWRAGKIVTLPGVNLRDILSIEMSNDERFIVTGMSDGTARVWDAQTKKLIWALRGQTTAVKSANFSPDGNYIVTGCVDGKIWVWDTRTGKKVAELRANKAAANHVEFSPDGEFVVTRNDDERVRIYPWEKFAPLEDLLRAAQKGSGRQFTPEEKEDYLHIPKPKRWTPPPNRSEPSCPRN